MIKRFLTRLLLCAALAIPVFGLAQTIVISQPALQNGPTITFTAAVAGSLPVPVQALVTNPGYTQQYVITNIGSTIAFVAAAPTSALATTNCVIPTGTATFAMPILATSQQTITAPPNVFFCGITSTSTSVIYVTPVIGE